MMKLVVYYCCILTFINVYEARLILKEYGMCKGEEYNNLSFHIYSEIVSENIINVNSTFDEPLGNGISLIINFEVLMMNDWRPLIPIKEKDICLGMNKLAGKFMEDLDQAMGIEPGVCPIPKGHYQLRNYKLNLDLLQGLPNSAVRAQVIGKQKNKVVYCTMSVVENI